MSVLGASGAGHAVTLGGKAYTFSAWTQAMMEAFETWLVGRLKAEANDTAEGLRKKSRRLFREAARMRERGIDEGDSMSAEEKTQLQEAWEDAAGEAQALEIEAREMVNRITERKAAGHYHFFGSLARESRKCVDGVVHMAYLSLKPN